MNQKMISKKFTNRKYPKRVLVMTGVLVLVLLTYTIAAGENLLKNPSFEDTDGNGLPSGWIPDAYVMEEGYTLFSVTEDDSVDGQKAVMIRNIGDNDARFKQQVSVEPEELYRFSGYIRTQKVEGGRGANFSIEGLYTFSESIFDSSDGWQYIEWYGETGEDQTEVTLYARLGGYSGESRGTAWFDDLKLEKVNTVPEEKIASRWYQEHTISYYDDEEETESGTAFSAWPLLIILSLFYTVIAILVMQKLRKDQYDLEDNGKKIYVVFYSGLAIALVVRLILSSQITGYMVDVNCFVSWGQTMAIYGPAGFYPQTNFCDYPPAYTYILGLNSQICQAIPHISDEMKRVVFRFFPSISDLLCCIVLDNFIKRREPSLSAKRRVSAILLLAYHPLLILNCAAWGQMDSVLALLLLLVAIWAIEEKWEMTLPCYTLAVLVKPQALMLGFLGLAAIIQSWIRQKEIRRKIIKGILLSVGMMIIVIVPFSLRQEPLWIVDQYASTLASYPYATVNTANFYYLLNGNWNAIANSAPGWGSILSAENIKALGNTGPAWAALLMTIITIGYGIWLWYQAGKIWKKSWIEEGIISLFVLWYIICGFSGAGWGQIGTAAMAFAFVIVLSLYIRKGDICFLPYLGGLLFLLLYVFGIKMHERYIFPAILLFAMAYGMKRDRRILYVFLAITFTSFINEGIVLDNSIRLGSARGHLNQDTYVLAVILSIINCFAAFYATKLGIEYTLPFEKVKKKARMILHDPPKDNRLHWQKRDTIFLSIILLIYSCISFSTLGSTKAPQHAWISSDYSENVILDLGEEHDNFVMLYFARVSRYDFSISVSLDKITWSDETWAQMDQGQCWKWKYVTENSQKDDGTRLYQNARHWFSGRYIRITAHQINLSLCEVIFRDEEGKNISVKNVERIGGDPESSLYSDPKNLIDEQNTMEAMPLFFQTKAEGWEGEENTGVAQPSWWNSTYFDEIYHARTAWEFLQGTVPYETSHPPLGKILMSWGISIFGMTPFGWRFAGATAGVAMLAVIYLVAKQMTKNSCISVFACSLLSLDCMHLTQTQIATIDSFPVLFIILSFFFMLRFLQSDWRNERKARLLADLGLCGFNMGLAIASKWIGVYAGAGLAVLYFWHGYRILRLNQCQKQGDTGQDCNCIRSKQALKQYIVLCGWCVLFFVVIPVLIYLLSYIPYFSYRHIASLREYLQAVLSSQEGMLNYHSTPGLGMDHPFYSPWYEWPIIWKPMFYSTKQYIFNDELSYSIFCFGNPIIWWSGIPALLLAAWCWVRNREEKLVVPVSMHISLSSLDTNLVFLLVGFLSQYLPWTLVPRGTYIYHYFASVPFLILTISIVMEQLSLHENRTGKIVMSVFILATLGAFILLFPYVSGILAPIGWLDLGRSWLKIWY